VTWSRVGACAFIYLAGFNIKVFILFLIGVAGTSFALSKPKRGAALMASIFALGLVLFGIQEIKSSTKILVEFDWFSTMIDFANTYAFVAFSCGFVFLLFAQSLFGALVVALGLLDTGVFGVQQAVLFTLGVYLAEAVLKLAYMPALKDAFKQTMCLLPIFYVVAFVLGTVFHVLDTVVGLSLLESLAADISTSSKQYLAHVNFAYHLMAAVVVSANAGLVERYLTRLTETTDKEAQIPEVEIPSGVLNDPMISMDLINKEEVRLISYLPRFQENLRSGKSRLDPSVQEYLHERLSTNFNTLRSTYQELLNRGSCHASISARILESIERQNLLMSLESNLNDFSTTVDVLRQETEGQEVFQGRLMTFVEALDTVLLSFIDVAKDADPFYVEVMETLTTERSDLFKEIRTSLGDELDVDQQVHLIKLVNLFESTIWILKKCTALYVSRAEGLEDIAEHVEPQKG
jgi:hypothetical protein